MSTLKVNNIQNASGGSNSTPEQIEQGRAKVWCSFDGTSGGTNKTIRDDFNVSTVVDNGTGDYTINYSITFANTNYVLAGTGGPNSEYISNVGEFLKSSVSSLNAAPTSTIPFKFFSS